jgi:putative transposase
MRYVAGPAQHDVDAGLAAAEAVGRIGQSRAAFLSNPSHRIIFYYTPKHCSWLNQIEIWLSILVRKLL